MKQAWLITPSARAILHTIDLILGHPARLQEALVDRLPAEAHLHQLAHEHVVRELVEGPDLVATLLASLPLRRLASVLATVPPATGEIPARPAVGHVDEHPPARVLHQARSIALVVIVQPPGAIARDGPRWSWRRRGRGRTAERASSTKTCHVARR